LNYFIKGADTNAFGVTQALTYFAQYDANAEERYELEMQSVMILDKIESFDKPEVKQVPSTKIVNLN
jgi:hypothetical protein